ncbi:MAG: GWxTD domain-containing protein [bacterium]
MRASIQIIRAWGFALALSIFVRNAGAQLPENSYSHFEDVPDFHYDLITSAAETKGQSVLHISMKIAYDELQFLRMEDGYRAAYEVNMMVFHPNGDPANGRIIRQDIEVNTFDETKSGTDFSLVENEFILLPGEYTFLVEIMDMDSKKKGRQEKKISIPDYFQKPFDVSDLFFIDSIAPDSTGKSTAVPSVLADYGTAQKSLFVRFEIYSQPPLDSVRITYYILDLEEEVLRKHDYYKVLDGERTIEYLEVSRGKLESGKYKFELTVGEGKATITHVKDFSVLWVGMPAFATDLDKAIEQMKYANKDVVKKIKKAKKADRERIFKEFWRSLDPSPNTTRNELMEEYYRRVDYANKQFGVFKQGWTTDQGMVYIILGPPNDVSRHPVETGSKPYEVWSYNDLNRSFVFRDDRGFGEYRLVTNWDVYSKLE